MRSFVVVTVVLICLDIPPFFPNELLRQTKSGFSINQTRWETCLTFSNRATAWRWSPKCIHGNLVFSTNAEQWWDENPTLLDPLTPMMQFWGLFLAVSWPLFTLPLHYYTITTSPNAHLHLWLPTNLWLSKFLLIVSYPMWNVPFLERQKGWQSVPSKYYKM